MTKTVLTRAASAQAMSTQAHTAETPVAESQEPSQSAPTTDDVVGNPQRQSPTPSMKRVRDPTPSKLASEKRSGKHSKRPSGDEGSQGSDHHTVSSKGQVRLNSGSRSPAGHLQVDPWETCRFRSHGPQKTCGSRFQFSVSTKTCRFLHM
jgi:hypothetical protein